MKGRLAGFTLAAGATTALVIVAVGWLAVSSLGALVDGTERVNLTYERVGAIERVRGGIANAEIGRHDYAMTRQPADLATYRTRLRELDAALSTLDDLTSRPSQRARFAALGPAIARRVGALDSIGAAPPPVHDDQTVARLLDDMREEETGLLADHLRQDDASGRRAHLLIVAAVAAGVVFVLTGSLLIAIGITHRLEIQQELRERDARLRAMFNTMVTGMVITNEDASIHSVNPAFARLTGYAEGDLIGRPIADLLVLAGNRDLKEERDRIRGSITQTLARRADGTTVPIEVSLNGFEIGGRQFFAANWTDISERQQVDRMKDEFISVVSHELRTPLTSIRAALQLVLSDPPEFRDEEHAPLLDIALSNCERLIRIINDILDVSKIEAGRLELHVASCSVVDLVRTSIQSVSEVARRAKVALVTKVEADAGSTLGDFDRLVQVFVNLLSNAVKFAPSGSEVTFTVDRAGDRVAFHVSDRGPGISQADQASLFQKFKQIDSSATRRAGGTGLGLSIVKALVEQHGGTVTLASEPGAGSTFTVCLPAAATEPAREPLAAASAGTRTILVVDDDDDIRFVLRKHLEGAGYRVLDAPDGQAALAVARAERPDLITMDLVMPGLGGIGTIRALAAEPATAAIPVVIVSAVADSVALDHPFAVLPKPLNVDALQREIELLLGRRSCATLLLAEDDDDLRNVLTASLSRSGFQVLSAEDGEVARRVYDGTRCDALIVDLHMPNADGFALIEHVRSTDGGLAVPIIVVSGSNTGDGERRSLQLGANVYFTKPVDAGTLVAELNRLVA